MISINNKQDCCGCTACAERCPQRCICMREDEEGFLYPIVDIEKCIGCNICEKVCPIINRGEINSTFRIYATANPDEETRKQSSSGGIFTLIAESVINTGGVVFGAKFDENWEVCHSFTETKEGLDDFRGSKYVQGRMEDNYKEVERFLKGGRKVLFSGTPCQISGLKHFLRKEYENLLTVDFICHGVPSPMVWRMFLDETIARQCEKNSVLSFPISRRNTHIKGISFRNKRLGWKKYSFALSLSTTGRSGDKNTVLLSEPLTKNIFLRGFMSNLYLRPSCYACKVREFRSSSDLTLADCWGLQSIYPKLDDDRGYSLCILKNNRFDVCLSSLDLHSVSMEFIKVNNQSCFVSPIIPSKRSDFFSDIYNGSSVVQTISRYATFPDKSIKAKIIHLLQWMGVYLLLRKMIKR